MSTGNRSGVTHGTAGTQESLEQMNSESQAIENEHRLTDQAAVSLPKHDAQLRHIFSGENGHLTDTPSNRQRLIDLANNPEYIMGKDKYGNIWNIKSFDDGSQDWVRYQNGVINEGGHNIVPRSWNDDTGLNNPFRKGK